MLANKSTFVNVANKTVFYKKVLITAKICYTNKKGGSSYMSVIKINKDNFKEIKKSEKKVLLDFYAEWCGPCRMVSPLVDEIAEENPQYFVGKINVDEEPELAAEFGVTSIPMLAVLQNGIVTDQSVGARPKAQILAMLEK